MKKVSVICKIILMWSFCLLCACAPQEDVRVVSVNIDEDTIPEYILAGEFDKAGIKAVINYNDGTNETIDVTSQFLKDSDKVLLDEEGKYEIEAFIKGVTVKLNINVMVEEVFHQVKFFDINNELISIQFVKEGEDAEDPFENLEDISGYYFARWDKEFKNVTEDIDVYGMYSKSEDDENIFEITVLAFMDTLHWLRFNDYVNEFYFDETTKSYVRKSTFGFGDDYTVVREYIGDQEELVYENLICTYDWSGDNCLLKTYSEIDGYNEETIGINDDGFEYLFFKVHNYVNGGSFIGGNVYYSSNKTLYRIVSGFKVDGMDSKQIRYEIIFDDVQVYFAKKYDVDLESNEEVLDYTVYYFFNPLEEDRVVFPSIE